MNAIGRNLVGRRSRDRAVVKVEGVPYSLHREPSGNWRLRKRTKFINLDVGLGTSALPAAKKKAAFIIKTDTADRHRLRAGGASLREFCDDYLAIPRDCRDYVAKQNIVYLAAIVRDVLGKTLEQARVSEITSDLWADFQRVRHGGRANYSLPRKDNAGINGAIRSARSVFAKTLERDYEKRGHRLNWDEIRRVKWLPELETTKVGEPVELTAEIRKLRDTDPAMWRAIGLARFAGLRQHEIQHARRNWLERDASGATAIVLMHRPDERFWHKTGKPYRAPVLDATLANDLWAMPEGSLLVEQPPDRSRDKWFDRDLNAWVRKFVPTGKGAMHRLRGFYADEIRQRTESITMAQLAGIKDAQQALGHTSEKTTVNHYLTDQSHATTQTI